MTERTAPPYMSDNILIALVPIVGTYLAYIYQWSYFSYYGIPPSLIEIDIPKIIFALVAIVLAAVVFLLLFGFISQFVTAKHPIERIAGKQLIMVLFFLPLIIASLGVLTRTQLLTYSAIFLVLGISAYIPSRNKAGEKLSYIERLKRQEEQQETREKNRPRTVRSFIGDRIVAPLGLVIFGSVYVSMLGYYLAGISTTHNALKSQPDAIYVTKHQDQFVFVRYDTKTRKLKKDLLFVSSSPEKPLELVTVETGQLLPASQ